MRKSFCSIVCFASFFYNTQFIEAITIEEALIAAFANNWNWKAGGTDEEMAKLQLDQSSIAFLPSVDGFINRTRTTGDTDYRNQQIYSIHENETNLGIRVTQNVFNGFSTLNQAKAAEFAAKAAKYKTAISEQELITKVLSAYTGIWAAREKVKALKKKEENLHKTLGSQKSALDAGASTASEVEQANANYQRAVFERTNAETELFTAESEFKKLTTLEPDDKIELPTIKFDIPESSDKLIQQAMILNSKIIYTRLLKEEAEMELKATIGRRAPSVNLSLQTSKAFDRSSTSNSKTRRHQLSLDVSIPILSNGTGSVPTIPAIQIASEKAKKAEFEMRDTIDEIKKDCIINWNTYISANALIQSSQYAVKSATISSESNLEETAMGLKSNTDVWVKENQLLESKVDLTNSQRQKFMASVKLLELCGKLNKGCFIKEKIKKLDQKRVKNVG